jgi:hypothetical protein
MIFFNNLCVELLLFYLEGIFFLVRWPSFLEGILLTYKTKKKPNFLVLIYSGDYFYLVLILLFTFLSRAGNFRGDFSICGPKDGNFFLVGMGRKSHNWGLEMGTWFYTHPVKTSFHICCNFGLNPYFFL